MSRLTHASRARWGPAPLEAWNTSVATAQLYLSYMSVSFERERFGPVWLELLRIWLQLWDSATDMHWDQTCSNLDRSETTEVIASTKVGYFAFRLCWEVPLICARLQLLDWNNVHGLAWRWKAAYRLICDAFSEAQLLCWTELWTLGGRVLMLRRVWPLLCAGQVSVFHYHKLSEHLVKMTPDSLLLIRWPIQAGNQLLAISQRFCCVDYHNSLSCSCCCKSCVKHEVWMCPHILEMCNLHLYSLQ